MTPAETAALAVGKWILNPTTSLPMAPRSSEVSRAWDDLAERIHSFRTLAEDWDGEGALPPELPVVDAAVVLAEDLKASGCSPAGRVFVGVNRTVIFEWFSPLQYAEIEVTGPSSAEYLVVDKASGITTVIPLGRSDS